MLTDEEAIRHFLKTQRDCGAEALKGSLEDVFRALTLLMYDESTGAAQKAAKCCRQFIATASTVSIADGT